MYPSKKNIQILLFGLIIISSLACKKKKTVAAPSPEKAILVFPEQNKACTEGTSVTATESTLLLNWNDAANAENYEVTIKNLNTGSSVTYQSIPSELSVKILKGTPFSWFVTSKSSTVATTATSDIWKFYNAGDRVESYAPYPAETVSPVMGEIVNQVGGKVTLSWAGSDADSDIVSYAVYFGTTSTPNLLKTNTSTVVTAEVTVASNTTYYWKIVTKDLKGILPILRCLSLKQIDCQLEK